jgi:hypothetical protein
LIAIAEGSDGERNEGIFFTFDLLSAPGVLGKQAPYRYCLRMERTGKEYKTSSSSGFEGYQGYEF